MDTEKIENEIAMIDEKLKPLQERRAALERELRRLRSVEFIRVNKVTRDQIEMSSGDGKPYFGHFQSFGKWLDKTDCQKRFCEWNGEIHSTSEAKQGRFYTHNPGRVEDVPLV